MVTRIPYLQYLEFFTVHQEQASRHPGIGAVDAGLD